MSFNITVVTIDSSEEEEEGEAGRDVNCTSGMYGRAAAALDKDRHKDRRRSESRNILEYS